MTDQLIRRIADLIHDNLDIDAAANPETGKPVIIIREGAFEDVARKVLTELER